MSVQALGYLGIRAKQLDDWASYGTGLLGLQRIDKSRATLAFRMDDRKQRIIVDADGGEGIGFFGWEVADAAALDALAARLEQNGTTVARGTRALACERRVQDLIVFTDPLGNRLEAFYGAETTTEPFVPGRSLSGFRTGPLGLGHVVLNVENVEQILPFYRDLLGFRLSDYYFYPFTAFFLHVNPRHHSLAFIQTGKNAVHHMMMELFSFDDVGQGYDLATAEEGPAITSPRSTAAHRLISWWNTAGAAARSIPPPGRRASARKGRASGVTSAPGWRRSNAPKRGRCASSWPKRAIVARCR
jgi:2,3-dihydroxybiphenyl 1,2-dioxygenase